MVINVMTRDVWHAEPPRVESMIIRKATHVFWMNVKRNVCYTKVHCIELLKRAQRYNMSIQNQRDIRYNFMVGGDGFVYEGRGWGQPPLLPREFARVNSESVVIGFMGFFNSAKELPEDMFKNGQDLVANGVASEFIHKDFQFIDLLSQHQSVRPTYNRDGGPSTEYPERRHFERDYRDGYNDPRGPSYY
ncbi:peptidoglycan-recognition protein SC2-like isoform X2 [Macrosteles quadrilineatus]|uniref:peptidoglycan-recognition protein SC2-like isoform X2 n=1 Tax=Macrosteles quadrilineatus TaxID=74068 RepID=UPI0023E1F4BC|nr:peptidoglycan-recognition protein SC2-like isoform X2 [Macrosteles quadrilineatus]